MGLRRETGRARRIGLVLAGVMTSSLGVAVVSMPPSPAAAGSAFTLIDDPDRIVLDATPDGSRVLTSAPNGSAKDVVDRVAGARIDVDDRAYRLSDDGQWVAYSTTDVLVPADADARYDVYAERLDGSQITLMSVGVDGLDFLSPSEFVDLSVGVLVAARDGFDWDTTVGYVIGPLAAHPLLDGLGRQMGPIDVNPVTHTVLMRVGDSFELQNYVTGVRRWLNLIPNGTITRIGAVALRPGAVDQVAFSDGVTGQVYVQSVGSGPPLPVGSRPALLEFAGGEISMSANGDVAYLTDAATGAPGQPASTAHQLALVRDGGAESVIESQPAGGRADGAVRNGFISDDGSTLLFSSYATNLAGTSSAVSVFATEPTPLPTPDRQLSVFTPRAPVRVLDTRPISRLGHDGPMPTATTSIHVPMSGRHVVPDDATAVAIQLTAAEGASVGYVSALATGGAPGTTSNLNIDEVGENISNFAIVPLGADGSITVFTQAATHVIVDLVGWFAHSPTVAARAGRYVAIEPDRVLDTRPESAVGGSRPKPINSLPISVRASMASGVPTSGVSALAVNITVTEPEQVGYVQTGPSLNFVVGASSTANVSRIGQTVAAATIVPVDSWGFFTIFMQMSAHVIVDVNGWFTDGTAPVSTSGLFAPLDTLRRVDTRIGSPLPLAPGTRFTNGADGSAAVGNVTVTETTGAGFVQLGPTATMVSGATSNINPTRPGETLANFFIAPVDGGYDVFTSNGTHIITDVVGYMTE
jgi:hypothetical protein